VSAQLILSLLLTSGVVSALVAHQLANSREEREFRRKKIEELYLAVHGFCMTFISHHLVWPRVMLGDMTYNEALDIQLKKSADLDTRNYETATMLINIYFPGLRERLAAILKSRDATNAIHGQFRKSYVELGPDSSQRIFVNPFNDAIKKFEAEHELFNKALFKEAESVNRSRIWSWIRRWTN
jgi:hypothetical protein